MQTDLINIGLGFLEGFALIISPCILPILPIILAGSLLGSKRRPLGIIVGFIVVFTLFTYFSRKLVQALGIDSEILRYVSYGLLFLFGLIMVSNYLTEKFYALTQRLTQVGNQFSTLNNPEGGFTSGLLFGGLVALIWTPCAGPILAAVIVQAVIQQTNFMSFLTVFAFAIGAALPMLLIAWFGRGILVRFTFIKTHTSAFRKILGIIIMLSVLFMMFFSSSIISSSVNESKPTSFTGNKLESGLSSPYPAPAIAGITAWINSKPLEINALRGKVVLIDFWTYSCINCIRTLPYLKRWYQDYHDKGLVIIGVHAPEFDFEKKLENVQKAVKDDGIDYPVALDNNFVTWRNYQNSYWPAHYLINQNGEVVYQHFGEGGYDVTENNIRVLLGLNKSFQPGEETPTLGYLVTPETYLGYDRAQRFSSNESVTNNQSADYTFPAELGVNDWALQGSWTIMRDKIVSSGTHASLRMHFRAGEVYMVMGSSAQQTIPITVTLNGKSFHAEQGKDVINGVMKVQNQRLYDVVNFHHAGEGILQIDVAAPGLEIYTFTFGQ